LRRGGNQHYGEYEIDAEGRLVVHSLGGTQVAYVGRGIDAQERRITAALRARPAIECSGGNLALKSDDVTLYGVEIPRFPSAPD
jgi:hypothetical protein